MCGSGGGGLRPDLAGDGYFHKFSTTGGTGWKYLVDSLGYLCVVVVGISYILSISLR